MSAWQSWLSQEVARQLKVPVISLSVERPLAEMGMDSIEAMQLAGRIETVLGTTIDPMLMYSYPTIERMAAYLGEQFPHIEIS